MAVASSALLIAAGKIQIAESKTDGVNSRIRLNSSFSNAISFNVLMSIPIALVSQEKVVFFHFIVLFIKYLLLYNSINTIKQKQIKWDIK